MLKLMKSLSRDQKKYIIVALDCILIPLSLWFAFNLQMSSQAAWNTLLGYLPVLPYLLIISGFLSIWIGVASVQLKSYEGGAIGQSAIFAWALASVMALLSYMIGLPLSIETHIVFGFSFFVFSVISRAVLLQVVLAIYRSSPHRCRVLIYGAGTTGMQLVSALRGHEEIEAVAFVDDNSALHGLTVSRLQVYTPMQIPELIEDKQVDRVVLAVPSLSPPKQAQIARKLQGLGIEVQTLPSFSQLIGEEELINKLTTLSPNSFLGRDEVAEALGENRNAYRNRSVLISGAGGSIGSELCRQVLDCRPAKLILFELSELALYNTSMELEQSAEALGVEIVPILGSVTDARHVRKILQGHKVDVILHAAAYKHVPLVESNPLAGLANNVLGTHTIAVEADGAGVQRFILVSSDKAVRPTNVMGASKRLAELVIQDLASRVPHGSSPIYSIVRFGNVLGSSGSVIPLFQEQVRRGGPLTVTHRDVKRYFMTVQEAVNLVLQAGAMAKGGEVFVLDMGKPVLIHQLARQVIETAGYTVRDDKNPDGDIEIEFTGLRPGEKMSEELTLSGMLIGSGHKKIFFAKEDKLSEIEVAVALRALRRALANGDEDAARDVALRWVEDFGRSLQDDKEMAQEHATPVT
ncbi:MAG: nucleoside-diphosphate sugar epimerase/dehydratase [Pseudomonadota bacterium]|mgnify:FL=1